jgi:hypothetical protein
MIIALPNDMNGEKDGHPIEAPYESRYYFKREHATWKASTKRDIFMNSEWVRDADYRAP